jgi:hypothetical protein
VSEVDVKMSADEVLSQIRQLQNNGVPLAKKKVKQNYPELMKSALYYFPSWEHAVQNTIG